MSLLLLSDAAPLVIPVALPTQTLANALSTASSSALQLADLALVWGTSSGDLSILDSDLASDRGLTTAVLISLFTDRRALEDDAPPSGDPADRRGWWADEFADVEGDKIGSRLWLLDRSKRTADVPLRADEYVREALAWMIEDQVVESIDLEIESKTGLLMGVSLQRPGKDSVSIRFAHVWNSLQEAT